jgi:hypothetical protein
VNVDKAGKKSRARYVINIGCRMRELINISNYTILNQQRRGFRYTVRQDETRIRNQSINHLRKAPDKKMPATLLWPLRASVYSELQSTRR